MSQSKNSNVEKVASNIDPEDIERWYERAKELEEKYGPAAREGFELIQELREQEQREESEEEDVAEKIEDAEDTGNSQELEASEQELEDAEENEEQIEKEADEAEEDVETEINIEEKQEQLIEKIQSQAQEELQAARKDLEDEMFRLQSVQESDNNQIKKADYEVIEEILQAFRDAVTALDKSTELLKDLTQEIAKTEKEEINLEAMVEEAGEEVQYLEKEAAELAEDYQQLQDSKHEQIAEKEYRDAEQLAAHLQEERQEQQSVDKEISKEASELENLVRFDRELEGELEQSIQKLQELAELLRNERKIWKFALNTNPPIRDINQTVSSMQDVLNRDETQTEKIVRKASKIKDKAPSISSSGSSSLFSGITGKSTPIVAGAAIIIVLLVVLSTGAPV